MASGSDGGPVHPNTLAYATDCSAYAADLETREDFGCVQWASPIIADHDKGDE
jgi:hypothetical protein